ncbi:high mobility group protein, putative [Babesia ovis]|uniref:High mobility group protein, putative n=1 Tax=Babesia ovis TaxID=5869 RepID=A0A9W5WV10_BABOV|nr:high mobility group protein, putative [Babesia ovis]
MAKEENKKAAVSATKARQQPSSDKGAKKKVDKNKKTVKKTTSAKDKGGKKTAEKKTAAKITKAVKTETAPPLFSKVGQKHVTPPKGDGTRGFYESLLEEHPNSVLAIVYCVEYGLFGGQKHQELYEKYQEMRKQGLLKGGSGGVKPAAIQFLQKFGKKAMKKQSGK